MKKHSQIVKNSASQKIVHLESHKGNNILSEVILGGQDGLVNVLGVILGLVGASQSMPDPSLALRLILAGGLAAVFAESISMGAVAYTSKKAERDFYLSELEREKREIEEVPDLETEEIRQIYREKGFKGKLLEDIVQVITSDKETWLETMMSEELKLSPVSKLAPFKAAWTVLLSTVIGSFIPIISFFFLPLMEAMYISLFVSAVALFIVGAVKARMTIGKVGRSGLEMATIGMLAALAGYGVGLLFQV